MGCLTGVGGGGISSAMVAAEMCAGNFTHPWQWYRLKLCVGVAYATSTTRFTPFEIVPEHVLHFTVHFPPTSSVHHPEGLARMEDTDRSPTDHSYTHTTTHTHENVTRSLLSMLRDRGVRSPDAQVGSDGAVGETVVYRARR